MPGLAIFLIIINSLIFGALCSSIASKKGYSGHYYWAGFFFSIVGLIYVGFLPQEKTESEREPSDKDVSAAIIRDITRIMADTSGTEEQL